MQINPYLHFNGQCEVAFKFYEQLFGGKALSMFKFSGSPMETNMPAEWHDKIMHASMSVAGTVIMGADPPPSHFKNPAGFSLSISVSDIAEAERIFAGLAEGGNVGMPLQQTFWALRFGMVTDRFGTPWLINCEQAA